MDDAHDACTKPMSAEPTYLPPYLCLAGLLDRRENGMTLATWSDRFQGLNLTGDMYSNYFRGWPFSISRICRKRRKPLEGNRH